MDWKKTWKVNKYNIILGAIALCIVLFVVFLIVRGITRGGGETVGPEPTQTYAVEETEMPDATPAPSAEPDEAPVPQQTPAPNAPPVVSGNGGGTAQGSVPEFAWQFVGTVDNEHTEAEMPKTTIAVVVNGTPHEIAQYAGVAEAITDFDRYGIPEDALLAAKYVHGTGEGNIYITRKSDTELSVMTRWWDSDVGSERPAFSELKVITIG